MKGKSSKIQKGITEILDLFYRSLDSEKPKCMGLQVPPYKFEVRYDFAGKEN